MANLAAMYHPLHIHGGFIAVITKDGFPVPIPKHIHTHQHCTGRDIIDHRTTEAVDL